MKSLQKAVAIVLIITMCSGCITRYKPEPVSHIDVSKNRGADAKNGVIVAIRGLSITEIDRTYALPLNKENIQPVVIAIQNNGTHRFCFEKENVELYRYTAEYIAIIMKKTNSFRSIFFGFFISAAMLIVHPFSVVFVLPMAGENWRKKGINRKIKEFVVGNEIEDTIIEPGMEHYGVFYTKTMRGGQEVVIKLIDEHTGEIISFFPRNE